ncbi:MAG: HPr family phosphocarrier protein [Clostridia bacterium]|nr:HPr family phosphocarrier protein [Clostridia bacterium]
MSGFRSVKIRLKSVDDVNEFVALASLNQGDVDVRSDRYVVDAKSILGVLSLDLKKVLTVDIYAGGLEDKLDKFIVEEKE